MDERGERTRRLAALDHRHVWHPFAPIEAWLDEDPLVIEATEGCELIDTEGNRYLDGVSSLWVNVHGHRNPAIDVAITGHLSRLVDSTFPRLTHPPAWSWPPGWWPWPPELGGRGAAVEVALKMAFSYRRHRGEERDRLRSGIHGRHRAGGRPGDQGALPRASPGAGGHRAARWRGVVVRSLGDVSRNAMIRQAKSLEHGSAT